MSFYKPVNTYKCNLLFLKYKIDINQFNFFNYVVIHLQL